MLQPKERRRLSNFSTGDIFHGNLANTSSKQGSSSSSTRSGVKFNNGRFFFRSGREKREGEGKKVGSVLSRIRARRWFFLLVMDVVRKRDTPFNWRDRVGFVCLFLPGEEMMDRGQFSI